MKRLYLYWLCLFCWTLPTVSNAQNDSVYTLKHVLKVHINYPDSALRLLDVMQEKKLQPIWLIDAQRAAVYSSHRKFRLSKDCAQRALTHDSLRNSPKYFMQAISCFVNACNNLGHYKEELQQLRNGIDYARSHNNTVVEANLLFSSGTAYYQLGKRKEADQYFTHAIEMGEKDETPRLKPFLSYFYGEYSALLTKERRYKEALDICEKREKLIETMKSYKNIPLGYLDQQEAYLYGKKAYILVQMKQKKAAEECYQKFSRTKASAQPDCQVISAQYAIAQHQYKLAEKHLLPLLATKDTITPNFAQDLELLTEIYEGMKNFQKAFQFQKRCRIIQDSLNCRKQKEDMAELATIHNLKEKEWTILQQEKEMEKNLWVRNLLIAGFTLACLLLWTAIYHLRTIKEKNRFLANKINAMCQFEQQIDTFEEKIDHLKQQLPETSKTETATLDTAFDNPTDGNNNTPSTTNNKENDRVLFRNIDRTIKEEKLFLNPDISRQDLLDRFTIDKNHFSRLLQEHIGMTLPQYLADIRIKYAIQTLKEHPNYTLQAISDESGFSNLRNFHRQFKATTGMTPSEFRNALNDDQK